MIQKLVNFARIYLCFKCFEKITIHAFCTIKLIFDEIFAKKINENHKQ